MKLVMSEGKEIEPHFESHAIVALVVGELNEGENLLDSREKTLVFSGRSRRWRFAPFYEQLFQAGIGFCGSAWRLVLSMERKRVEGYMIISVQWLGRQKLKNYVNNFKYMV